MFLEIFSADGSRIIVTLCEEGKNVVAFPESSMESIVDLITALLGSSLSKIEVMVAAVMDSLRPMKMNSDALGGIAVEKLRRAPLFEGEVAVLLRFMVCEMKNLRGDRRLPACFGRLMLFDGCRCRMSMSSVEFGRMGDWVSHWHYL